MITHGVQDLGRALSFYRDGLAYQVGFRKQNIALFRLQGARWVLHPSEDLVEEIGLQVKMLIVPLA